jgi:ERCC4-type nuclease
MDEIRHANSLPTTILRDTREQRPWTFDGCAVETHDVTLSTGDYTVPTACTHDPESDTYHPRFAVERKSGQDFLTALTWERDRFSHELRRAAEWPHPLAVVVETSWETLLRNRGCMAWRDIHLNAARESRPSGRAGIANAPCHSPPTTARTTPQHHATI